MKSNFVPTNLSQILNSERPGEKGSLSQIVAKISLCLSSDRENLNETCSRCFIRRHWISTVAIF